MTSGLLAQVLAGTTRTYSPDLQWRRRDLPGNRALEVASMGDDEDVLDDPRHDFFRGEVPDGGSRATLSWCS